MKIVLELEMWSHSAIEEYIEQLEQAEKNHIKANKCTAKQPCNEIRHLWWLGELFKKARDKYDNATILVREGEA